MPSRQTPLGISYPHGPDLFEPLEAFGQLAATADEAIGRAVRDGAMRAVRAANATAAQQGSAADRGNIYWVA